LAYSDEAAFKALVERSKAALANKKGVILRKVA
jgi:hypothetical protein